MPFDQIYWNAGIAFADPGESVDGAEATTTYGQTANSDPTSALTEVWPVGADATDESTFDEDEGILVQGGTSQVMTDQQYKFQGIHAGGQISVAHVGKPFRGAELRLIFARRTQENGWTSSSAGEFNRVDIKYINVYKNGTLLRSSDTIVDGGTTYNLSSPNSDFTWGYVDTDNHAAYLSRDNSHAGPSDTDFVSSASDISRYAWPQYRKTSDGMSADPYITHVPVFSSVGNETVITPHSLVNADRPHVALRPVAADSNGFNEEWCWIRQAAGDTSIPFVLARYGFECENHQVTDDHGTSFNDDERFDLDIHAATAGDSFEITVWDTDEVVAGDTYSVHYQQKVQDGGRGTRWPFSGPEYDIPGLFDVKLRLLAKPSP